MAVIAIDGPSGSGKSTVAACLAARLQVPWLSSGALYRAVTRLTLDRLGAAAPAALVSELGALRALGGDRRVGTCRSSGPDGVVATVPRSTVT